MNQKDLNETFMMISNELQVNQMLIKKIISAAAEAVRTDRRHTGQR